MRGYFGQRRVKKSGVAVKYLPHMNPWTQPTDEFREICIGTFDNLKLFRANSRKQVTATIASMVSEIYFSINFVWS
jgi:hypothetical protein